MEILFILLLTLLIIVFLRRPKYALFAYLAFAPFSYYYAYFSSNSRYVGDFFQKSTRDFLVLIFYGFCLLYFFVKGKNPRINSKAAYFILFFAAMIFMQFLQGLLDNEWISAVGLRDSLEFMPFVFVTPMFLSKKKDVRGLINGLFLVSFVVSLLGFYQSFGLHIGVPQRIALNVTVYRMFSTLLSPNNLGAYLTIFGLLLLNFILGKHYLVSRSFSIIVCVTLFAGTFFTYSRSALLGFLIGAGYLTYINHKKIFWAWAWVFTLVVTLLILISPISIGRHLNVFEQGLSERSLLGRFLHIVDFAKAVDAQPHIFLSGAGFYGTSTMYYELGKGIVTKTGIGTDNYFLFLLASGGIFLLFVFCAMLYFLFMEAKYVASMSNDLYFKCLANGLKGIIVALVFMGLLSNIWQLFPCNLYFWFLIGLLFIAKREIALSKQHSELSVNKNEIY